ncbi:MAG: hypothetical protein GY792_13675 [Gammaproteobacteria bacterium]|nr:hypothetical protein [Gammaproteobacteria bacterium]
MADDNNQKPTQVSDHALEMVMRDVLDGMLELSLESAYSAGCADFEIIEITPAHGSGTGRQESGNSGKDSFDQADILPFPQLRKAAC